MRVIHGARGRAAFVLSLLSIAPVSAQDRPGAAPGVPAAAGVATGGSAAGGAGAGGSVAAGAASGGSAAPTPGERATGGVTMRQSAPEPRSIVIERPGAPPVVVPRDRALEVSGANVVVIDETPQGAKLTVQNDVLFDFDRSALLPEAEVTLRRVAEIIRDRAPREVLVLGHTDSVGSDAYNKRLSEERARAVERWLESSGGGGLPPIRTEGRGESEPVAPNEIRGQDNPAGRQQNRRVEVVMER